MRWLLAITLLLVAAMAHPQAAVPASPTTVASISGSTSDDLPDAPSVVDAAQSDVVAVAQSSFQQTGDGIKPCNAFRAMKVVYYNPHRLDEVPKSCSNLIYPYQKFLGTNIIIPMTWQEKGYLALHDLADPANFVTIVGISAISVAADSHSAYGPGFKGFGKSVGVSYLQDVTGQFFGAFAIPVLFHQDPRYFRMPNAPLSKRILYSVSRTVISRHDDGRPMPNYSVLLNYPIGAVLANQYVPGVHNDASSTVTRIATGYALDPANNLLNEFLPDVASHVHVRIIFVQRILNNIANGTNGVTLQ
ncbi:hypothetical protein RBB79_20790 [Tunturiibacter empetritectus]|uniref:Uncharacterized protein n=1 Tax=Tunturiibacter lichenicola TaxID=2051959 RepID=A0A852VH43_9BACT|nr:hypothetical protein [Edaphobacter lichenicola]NYF92123.1 hypothetical protein [Edaphobacter lichenicola]